jgi:hypothetical protein
VVVGDGERRRVGGRSRFIYNSTSWVLTTPLVTVPGVFLTLRMRRAVVQPSLWTSYSSPQTARGVQWLIEV